MELTSSPSPRRTIHERLEVDVIRLPVKVALQPRLLVGASDKRRYVWWRGQIWRMECRTLDELAQLRKALDCFFKLLDELGDATTVSKVVYQALRTVTASEIRRKTPVPMRNRWKETPTTETPKTL